MTLNMKIQPVTADEHQERIERQQEKSGRPNKDKITATPGASQGLKKWAAAAFAHSCDAPLSRPSGATEHDLRLDLLIAPLSSHRTGAHSP